MEGISRRDSRDSVYWHVEPLDSFSGSSGMQIASMRAAVTDGRQAATLYYYFVCMPTVMGYDTMEKSSIYLHFLLGSALVYA